MAVIDVVLRNGVIWIPADFPVRDNTLTWKIWSETEQKRDEKEWILKRTPLLDATWLVSFRDGTSFDVGPIGKTETSESPDVTNGQEIRLLREPHKGRYSYRLAIHVDGKPPYAVFDCPSIIII